MIALTFSEFSELWNLELNGILKDNLLQPNFSSG